MTEHSHGHAHHEKTTATAGTDAATAPAAGQSGFAAFVAAVEADGEKVLAPVDEVVHYVESNATLAAAAGEIKTIGLAFLQSKLPGVPVTTIVTVLEGLLAEIAPTVAAIPNHS